MLCADICLSSGCHVLRLRAHSTAERRDRDSRPGHAAPWVRPAVLNISTRPFDDLCRCRAFSAFSWISWHVAHAAACVVTNRKGMRSVVFCQNLKTHCISLHCMIAKCRVPRIFLNLFHAFRRCAFTGRRRSSQLRRRLWLLRQF